MSAKYNKVVVILRTCDRVNAVSGHPRINEKSEVIRRCFNSLLSNIRFKEFKTELIIVDDHSSEETVHFLKENAPTGAKFVSLTKDTGNGASLAACYQIADSLPDDVLIFFLEDDYLLCPEALSEMVDIHNEVGPSIRQDEVVTHPVDYPDRYSPDKLYSSYIVLGRHRHWRTVGHTTGTLMISSKAFKAFRNAFGMFTQYGTVPGVNEDNTINTIYSKIPCFSPMPSLGHHYQYESTMSPYLSYEELWDNNEYHFEIPF